jgi:ABC-2 type transport system ATP-binding protein
VSDVVLRVEGLAKTFHKPVLETDWLAMARLAFGGAFGRAGGLVGKKVEAVRGVSFEVERGEIFGFLGPNGAGKTTTIKMLTGLIAATRGSAAVFGVPIRTPQAMARVGFLPENPYIYPYLTPREFVTLCGQLSGMKGPKLHRRVEQIVERVGIPEAIDRPARALSKGMLQRAGLAAALVHEPELLILDEPMSGLDPVGRKEVRDLIVEEKRAGRTIFFSSHILTDVELLCDRVCILRQGEVVVAGVLRKLLDSGTRRREIHLSGATEALKAALRELGGILRPIGESLAVELDGDEALRSALTSALAEGATIESVAPKRETLEDLFVRRAL